MNRAFIIFILLTSLLRAQEDWGEADYLWSDFGGICYLTEPGFGLEHLQVIVTIRTDYDVGYRIMDLNMSPILPESLSVDGYNDISPNKAYDLSALYFASDRPGGYGGFDIWKIRYIGGEWNMPENLGQNINTIEDETGPTLNYLQDEIFFHRGVYDLEDCSVSGHIFTSVFDGGWQQAEALPAPVRSDYSEFKPSLNFDADKLYFVSDRPNGLEINSAVWVSYRQQGIWLEPHLLIGQVNEVIYSQPDCAHYNVVSISIDLQHPSWLVFNKLGICNGCPEGRVYSSLIPTGMDEAEIVNPDIFSCTAYPNPFNLSTTIKFSLPEQGEVTLSVYNLLGQRVATLFEGTPEAGEHTITWDATDFPSGVYFARLETDKHSENIKMVLLR